MTPSLPSTDPTPGGLELPRPPGVIRRFLAAHPLLVDTALVTAYFVPSILVTVVTQIMTPSVGGALAIALVVVASGSFYFRRHRPRVVFAVAMLVLASSTVTGEIVDFLPALVALYALAVYRSTRSAWIGFAITAAVTVCALWALSLLEHAGFYGADHTEPATSTFTVLAFSLVAVLMGNNIGGRRRYLTALIDRARQLARERDQQAVIAAAAERSRIAREMHDIVSHSLTVMITLSEGSARLADTAPERSADTMRMVAETGRSALGDMRRLLGVLRAGEELGADHQPQPGVGDLGELIERFRAAGMSVRVTVTGDPPTDVGQQLTVFRVVQEGLTNALRYGRLADTVEVIIRFRPDRIAITVEDDAAMRGDATEGSGRGLIGLRERVALYNGTLDAGPRVPAGWRLHAEFDAVRPAAPAGSPPASATPEALHARTARADATRAEPPRAEPPQAETPQAEAPQPAPPQTPTPTPTTTEEKTP
ncbi:sensor histidine kinase [Leifsonia aquatica]|uniref:sensor histidine kinase n=1 Tax=Leifsonia aquatica TaxID=144185 RepID=UPI00046AB16F|nr:sensor histidine kinase [Leifsonia aquatica]